MKTVSIDFPRLARVALEAGGVAAGDVSLILADHSVPGYVGYTLFVLERRIGRPLTVVKVTTWPHRVVSLEQEFANLRRLRGDGPPDLREAVATPLALGREGEASFLALEPLPGVRMPAGLLGRQRVAARYWRAFELAVDRLGDLARLPGGRGAGPALDAGAEVAAFRASHRRSAALDRLLDRAVRSISERRPRLPPAHGDYCADNLLVTAGGGLFIVDWECPLDTGWPFSDLLTLLTSLAGRPGKGGAEALARSYQRLLFGSGPHRDRIQRAAERHRRAIGLAPDQVVPASVLAWVAHANRKHAELEARRAETTAPLAVDRHSPLIMIDDGHCLNLEILAEFPDRYLLASPANR